MTELVTHLPDPFIGVLPPIGIEDIPLKNPGIPTVLVVSVVCRTPMPNGVIDVLKHILGERALMELIPDENAPQAYARLALSSHDSLGEVEICRPFRHYANHVLVCSLTPRVMTS